MKTLITGTAGFIGFNLAQRLLAAGRAPAEVMAEVAAEDARRDPYGPCPCGSGSKFRFCHGGRAPAKPPSVSP